jgi:hypothetical protein
MSMESFMKLCLGHTVTSWLCDKKVCLPSSCSTSKPLGCEHGLLIISAVNEIKLLLHGAKPVICFQWFICPGEHWRTGISEVHISGLISIVITTAVALWCILIILGHFSQQSSIFSGGINKSSNGLYHSWWNWWWIRGITPTLGGSSTISSMSTSRHLFITSQNLFINFY